MSQAHQFNIDAAQREIDQRAAEGEDMTGATIDQRTYAIVKSAPRREATLGQFFGLSPYPDRA